MNQAFLVEFGIILVVAAGLGIITRLLKQPLILAYVIAGVLIGLKLNPRRLLEIGGSVARQERIFLKLRKIFDFMQFSLPNIQYGIFSLYKISLYQNHAFQ